MKFPKFVKDKELISILKGMLTKNTMKRILKLSQIRTNEYFKDFNWDNLLSFNLDPPYSITMPAEAGKEISSYNDYIADTLKDFKPTKDMKSEADYKDKVEQWFNKL